MNSMSSLWEFLSQDTAFFGGPQSPMLSWLGSCGIVLFFVWQLIRLTVEVARARRPFDRVRPMLSALANDLDVPRALDIAIEEGGQVARDLTTVLAL